jgi:hypothetical protein
MGKAQYSKAPCYDSLFCKKNNICFCWSVSEEGKKNDNVDPRYEEFMKVQPDYKSTKKNLWRKYKWYKLRMGQDKTNELSPKKEEQREGPTLAAVPIKLEPRYRIRNTPLSP